jgi:signal transduction histidine kinase
LRTVFRDDGVGIPAEVLQDGHREGHLGMLGMRERARQLGARIEIGKPVGGGTVVELIVPAAVIYATKNLLRKETSRLYLLKLNTALRKFND